MAARCPLWVPVPPRPGHGVTAMQADSSVVTPSHWCGVGVQGHSCACSTPCEEGDLGQLAPACCPTGCLLARMHVSLGGRGHRRGYACELSAQPLPRKVCSSSVPHVWCPSGHGLLPGETVGAEGGWGAGCGTFPVSPRREVSRTDTLCLLKPPSLRALLRGAGSLGNEAPQGVCAPGLGDECGRRKHATQGEEHGDLSGDSRLETM